MGEESVPRKKKKKNKTKMWHIQRGSRDGNVGKEMYFRYMRMTPRSSEHFLRLVSERISKQTTNYRELVPPEHI